MAALWTRICKNSLWRNLNKHDPSGEKTSLLWPGRQKAPFPKGIHFPGVWDQSHLKWLLLQHYQLRAATAFSDLCDQQPTQRTCTWAQVEQLCRKFSREDCTILITQGVVLKDNDDFSSETSSIILSLCVFLFRRDLQSLEKQVNGAKQTTTLILGSGYLG